MTSCNSWQYLGKILAKIFPRSWQDLAMIVLRYPWSVNPGSLFSPKLLNGEKPRNQNIQQKTQPSTVVKFHLNLFFSPTRFSSATNDIRTLSSFESYSGNTKSESHFNQSCSGKLMKLPFFLFCSSHFRWKKENFVKLYVRVNEKMKQ